MINIYQALLYYYAIYLSYPIYHILSTSSQVNIQRMFSVTHFEFWVTRNKIYYLHVPHEKPLHCS